MGRISAFLVVVFQVSLASTQTTYHIRPTSESSCPHENCLTLAEFASDTTMYSNSSDNLTLEFLPGEHVLNTSIVFRHLGSLMLLGNSSSLPNVTSRIVCLGLSTLTLMHTSSLMINALGFSYCGHAITEDAQNVYGILVINNFLPAISALFIPRFHLVSCLMEHNRLSIYVYKSTLTSQACKFKHNTGDYGGAVLAEDSTVQFARGTSFQSNSAANSGGAIFTYFCTLLIGDCVLFTNNRASAHGGSISAHHSYVKFGSLVPAKSSGECPCEWAYTGVKFEDNKGEHGGALLADHSTIEVGGQSYFQGNLAFANGGAISAHFSELIGKASAVFKDNKASGHGGGISAYMSKLRFDRPEASADGNRETSILFEDNSAILGGALQVINSSITISVDTLFRDNRATHQGGGIFMYNRSTLVFTRSTVFANNQGSEYGGGIASFDSEISFGGLLAAIRDSNMSKTYTYIFQHNSVWNYGGGAMYAKNSVIEFTGISIFANNSATIWGAGIMAEYCTLCLLGSNTFQYNNAGSDGGGLYASSSTLSFAGSTNFESNTVDILANGGGIFVNNSKVDFSGLTTFVGNSATSGAGLAQSNSTVEISVCIVMEQNRARESGGGIYLSGGSLNISGNGTYVKNRASISGGVVSITSGAVVVFQGNHSFKESRSMLGGAVSQESNSQLSLLAEIPFSFTGNQATYGGAIFSDSGSILLVNGEHTFDGNSANHDEFGGYGGSIFARGTKVTLGGKLNFTNNTATYGGAIAIAQISKLKHIHLLPRTNVQFSNNFAEKHGGAIFVEEDLVTYCASNIFKFIATSIKLELTCSFQITSIYGDDCDCKYDAWHILYYQNITFESNTAKEGGNSVYGGALESCIVHHSKSTGIELLAALVGGTVEEVTAGLSNISSEPFKVCACDSEFGLPDCNRGPITNSAYPGETLLFPMVAVGQTDGAASSVVQARFNGSGGAWFDPLQRTQSVSVACTPLGYTLFSRTFTSAQLELFAAGQCGEAGIPLVIVISFLPCPEGFSLAWTGSCGCHSRMQRYTNSCDINTRTITRSGEFWVGLDYHGLILHPHCPFDYCKLETVSFTLNTTDLQCAHGRSGTLCGACKSGQSLNLGSSQCTSCSNVFLLLFLVFAIAGFLLVLFLFICKVTVAAGTTSGLIFYANVLAVNKSVFFPSGDTNILTVFIAWMNLDFGIETCFIDGLDAYTRTWLQFFFPLYIWLLVGIITLVSHYSTFIARIIGPTNPIAVLATLFLLSYTKLLRTIIATFSFTTLDYPNDESVTVWVYDGNIRFLEGKHIPLFLAGLLAFLLLFLPYTLLLLFGQCVEAGSNHKLLSWANNLKVKSFLDAYHAPYKNRHRYWTGLLLLIRFILFITSAVIDVNSPRDPSVNFLVLGVTCAGMMVLSWNIGGIHKKSHNTLLESSFILNLTILALASYQVQVEGGSQAAVVYTSVSIALVTFVGIVAYHVVERVRDSRTWRHSIVPKVHGLREKLSRRQQEREVSTVSAPSITAPPALVTTTYIDLREPLNLIETQH